MPTSVTKFLDSSVTDRIARTAGGTIAAKRLVKLDAATPDATKVLQAGANEDAIGVAEVSGSTGDELAVQTAGRAVLEAGGTVAIGDAIVADANGRGVVRGTTATTLYNVIGFALTAAASGEHFTLQISRHRVWGANAS